MASIGVGGQGAADTDEPDDFGNLAAIGDVDEDKLNRLGGKRFRKGERCADFRKMLDEMGKSIGAVTVRPPAHTHAPAALVPMGMGRHCCFSRKPVSHSVYETILIARVTREEKGKLYGPGDYCYNEQEMFRLGSITDPAVGRGESSGHFEERGRAIKGWRTREVGLSELRRRPERDRSA